MAKKLPSALSLVAAPVAADIPFAAAAPAAPATAFAAGSAEATPAAQISGAVSTVIEQFVKPAEAAGREVGKTINPNPLVGIFAGFGPSQMEAKTKMENAMKTGEQMVSFGQGNVEAMMKSSQIWAAGVQDLGKSFAAAAQAQLDQTMSTWKALAGVKSLKEAIDLQSSLARSSVEQVVTQTGQITDASMKLAEQAMAPITARVSLAVEQFGRAA